MRRHPIVPRKWFRDGVPNWKVRVPLDLQSPDPKENKSFNFRNEADAIAKARVLSIARLSLAAKFLKLPQIEQAKVLRRYEEENSQTNVTVAQAAGKCLAEKKLSGKRGNSLAAARGTFNSMIAAFGNKALAAVLPDDIKTWLAAHPAWSPKTVLNNQKYAASLFNWGINNRILTYNPCKGVLRPTVPFKPVEILTVAQIRQLLKTCFEEDRALLGFLVLVLFGGLRVAEARRCLSSNLTKGKIDLGGESCKLNVRRCVDISPQLGAWLGAWQSDGGLYGKVGVPNFANRLQSLVKLSGVTLPKNCLRHSFCSYTLELRGADATARAANNSPAMLFKHYAAMVTKEDAQAFAEILP